jgi:hypothetical protein
MSAPTDTGGSAFPAPPPDIFNSFAPPFAPVGNGLTVLDWFAGQALAGMYRNAALVDNYSASGLRAKEAYFLAAAMLAEKRRLEKGDVLAAAELDALRAERDALAAWKKDQLTVTAWWAEIDTFVRAHPDCPLGCHVSKRALEMLQERDALRHDLEQLEKPSVDEFAVEQLRLGREIALQQGNAKKAFALATAIDRVRGLY